MHNDCRCTAIAGVQRLQVYSDYRCTAAVGVQQLRLAKLRPLRLPPRVRVLPPGPAARDPRREISTSGVDNPDFKKNQKAWEAEKNKKKLSVVSGFVLKPLTFYAESRARFFRPDQRSGGKGDLCIAHCIKACNVQSYLCIFAGFHATLHSQMKS